MAAAFSAGLGSEARRLRRSTLYSSLALSASEVESSPGFDTTVTRGRLISARSAPTGSRWTRSRSPGRAPSPNLWNACTDLSEGIMLPLKPAAIITAFVLGFFRVRQARDPAGIAQ